jgi:hypothetical protein
MRRVGLLQGQHAKETAAPLLLSVVSVRDALDRAIQNCGTPSTANGRGTNRQEPNHPAETPGEEGFLKCELTCSNSRAGS